MTLPNPSLDDKPFQEIVEEAKKKIQVFSRTWTDHNLSDPGITFLELFAWLAETQIYSLNRIPEKHYLKFLKLLDVRPHPPLPAKVAITFDGSGVADTTELPKGTQIRPTDVDRDMIFDTDELQSVLPLVIYKVASLSRRGFHDKSLQATSGTGYFHPFSENPTAGSSSLYLGLDKTTPNSIDSMIGDRIAITIYLYQEDLPPEGSHGSEAPMILTSNRLAWEYLGSTIGTTALEWLPLSLLEDTTNALTTSGRVSFNLPFKETDKYEISQLVDNDGTNNPNKPLFWIRCRLVENHYEIAPRIQIILLNTSMATYGWIKEKSYTGNGLPDQSIQLYEQDKIIFEIIEVTSSDGSLETKWKKVDDLDASDPEDFHYTVDIARGNVTFGNGEHGRIPKIALALNVRYRFGLVEEHSVLPANTTFRNVSGPAMEGKNYFLSSKVKGQESIVMAMARARSELRIPFKAVSATDFEFIAKSTPGLRVSRAKAFASSEENTVIVIVVPYSFVQAPKPSKGFLDTVCHHLDRHRLITTRLKMMEPEYVGISVYAKITVSSSNDPELVRQRVLQGLKNFMSPIKRTPEQNEWPFGRDVYKSEVFSVIENALGVDCVIDLFMSGSGKQANFENKEGNVIIKNLSLVYLKNLSIDVIPPTTECLRKDTGS